LTAANPPIRHCAAGTKKPPEGGLELHEGALAGAP
jgi:hypothetical protein